MIQKEPHLYAGSKSLYIECHLDIEEEKSSKVISVIYGIIHPDDKFKISISFKIELKDR